MPLRIKIVATLFIIEGGWALWDTIVSLGTGDWRFDIWIIWLLIGVGILRRINGWRILALLLLPLIVVLSGCMLLVVQFSDYPITMTFGSVTLADDLRAIPICAFIVFKIVEYWILAAHSVGPMFKPHWSEK